jgi:hypothetical protein
MPKVSKGPSGPRRGAAGHKGTNKKTPSKGASTSGVGAPSLKFTHGLYGK